MINEIVRSLNFYGLIIGLATFLIIGLFHPLVIKGEYHFGQRCRWWFFAAGVLFLIATLLTDNSLISSLLGVTAFCCFWSIKEIKEQEERVRKGWFPKKPSKADSANSNEGKY